MPEARQPAVYAIGAQRGFADVLASGLLKRFGDDRLALARANLLITNHRAGRAITDALVRLAASGLLLPRMVLIGDILVCLQRGFVVDQLELKQLQLLSPSQEMQLRK